MFNAIISNFITLFSMDSFKLKSRLAKMDGGSARAGMVLATIVSDSARLLVVGVVVFASLGA